MKGAGRRWRRKVKLLKVKVESGWTDIEVKGAGQRSGCFLWTGVM